MKISVIVPVYNVEPFIERCVRSLMKQGLDNVEYIFVDDCSPDRSMEIVEAVTKEYLHKENQVKIIRHETNRGLPAARNTGLEVATGDYIFHCDSDDYLQSGALYMMYQSAIANNADIVYSDWLLSFGRKERYMHQPVVTTPAEALKLMLHGRMKWNVWNKLVRRSLYNEVEKIRFPEGHGMGEDMTMLMLVARAKSIIHVPMGAYHYNRQNTSAFTAQRSDPSYDDLKVNADRVIVAMEGIVSDEDLACFKLNVKFPFIISSHREDYERWNEWYPEANAYISASQTSWRMRLLQKAAAKKRYWVLRVYYYCIHKVIYGLFY